MTIILYTDASTRKGYSCYTYKYCNSSKIYVGIKHTSNTALAETVAVIKGLQRLENNEKVLVISDFMGVVTNILNYRKGVILPFIYSTYKSYKKARVQLFNELDRLDVDAVWVGSAFPNENHLEVDNYSKLILKEFVDNII